MQLNMFHQRLSQLRMAKGVSARDMSLSLGQSPGYINAIENQKGYPSMQLFFYICEYLGVTPSEFFDPNNPYPQQYQEIVEELQALDAEQLQHVRAIIRDLGKKQ